VEAVSVILLCQYQIDQRISEGKWFVITKHFVVKKLVAHEIDHLNNFMSHNIIYFPYINIYEH